MKLLRGRTKNCGRSAAWIAFSFHPKRTQSKSRGRYHITETHWSSRLPFRKSYATVWLEATAHFKEIAFDFETLFCFFSQPIPLCFKKFWKVGTNGRPQRDHSFCLVFPQGISRPEAIKEEQFRRVLTSSDMFELACTFPICKQIAAAGMYQTSTYFWNNTSFKCLVGS